MIEIPWWVKSPSPYTFIFWILLGLYGCYKLKPKGLRDWIVKFSTCAFVVGLVILPFDLLWTINQALTFGHLHPSDLAELLPLFNLKLILWIVCLYECRNMFKEKQSLKLMELFYLVLYIPFMMVWFTLAKSPSWTDWTYAFRFGCPGCVRDIIIKSFFISHVLGKTLQGAIYLNLWKRGKEIGEG